MNDHSSPSHDVRGMNLPDRTLTVQLMKNEAVIQLLP
jgi:hypothetical protein